MKLLNLRLDQLDFSDESFRISYFPSLERLRRSIQAVGLVHPLIVTGSEDRRVIVSGWKRALVCAELGIPSVHAVEMEGKSRLDLFFISFFENFATREFSLPEKAFAARRLLDFGLERGRVIKDFLPLLKLHPVPQTLKTLSSLSAFEPQVLKLVQGTGMTLQAAEALTGFSPAERRLLLPLLASLGLNKQREFLEDLYDLCLRDGTSVQDILGSEEIRSLLDSTKLVPLAKAEKVSQVLRRKKNPYFYAWKDAFERAAKKLRLPKKAAVAASPRFEDEEMTLSVRFNNPADLMKTLSQVQDLLSEEILSGLFRMPGNPEK